MFFLCFYAYTKSKCHSYGSFFPPFLFSSFSSLRKSILPFASPRLGFSRGPGLFFFLFFRL